nr:uncharacterized protein LOC109159537 [Ipomoea trifida]
MFYRRFIESARLPKRANDTFVVLIPKKLNLESMKDLRPIALCNVLYKIAAKVCANRLKPMLEGLISGAQSAFIPGRRLITDNIMLAYGGRYVMQGPAVAGKVYGGDRGMECVTQKKREEWVLGGYGR